METIPLTTGEIALHCKVTNRAILKWITSGKLKAYRTPGRHTRVNLEDFIDFLNKYKMPIPGSLQPYLKSKMRILIVDDDRTMVETLKGILKKAGNYEIDVAYDGFSAGLKFSEFKPDLITLDLNMPNFNGYEVCKYIRSKASKEDVKILAISGFLSEDNAKKILDLGADDCLNKPVRAEDVIEKVNHLLNVHAQAAV